MRARVLYSLLLGWLCACAGASPTPATPRSPAATPTAANAEDLRTLPPEASFADLVGAARLLDEASDEQSSADCLLRGRGAVRLSANLMPGVRPLPSPPEALAERIEGVTGMPTVLTAWDRVDGDAALVLAAFTTTTARAVHSQAAVLFVTRAGTFMRGHAPRLVDQRAALSSEAIEVLLTQLTSEEASVVYVTADAGVPVLLIREVLRSIPDRFEVALAVVLPEGTQLPSPSAPSNEWLCPDGLPEPADDEPEGDIDPQPLRDALRPLGDAALGCAQSTGGRAAVGGRLVLALRLGLDGRVAQACFPEDEIGEANLRRCIVANARALPMPRPSPTGFVDVTLPLQLSLISSVKQRAVCE